MCNCGHPDTDHRHGDEQCGAQGCDCHKYQHNPYYVEYEKCTRCDGSGQVHWYLGDEFNSQGWGECDICEGTGVMEI